MKSTQGIPIDNIINFYDSGERPPKPANQASEAVRQVLLAIGEDPNRQGLLDTPKRVANMYGEIFAGYATDPTEVLNGALFDVEYDEMVVVKDIEFHSMCEHTCCLFQALPTLDTCQTRRLLAFPRSLGLSICTHAGFRCRSV